MFLAQGPLLSGIRFLLKAPKALIPDPPTKSVFHKVATRDGSP
jgi:hypothetical protein